jgi:hypothetical protein
VSRAFDIVVAAMMADLRRQECRLQPYGSELDSGYDGARFDVAQTAAAGLRALRNLDDEALIEIIEGCAAMEGVQHGLVSILDAVLRGRP